VLIVSIFLANFQKKEPTMNTKRIELLLLAVVIALLVNALLSYRPYQIQGGYKVNVYTGSTELINARYSLPIQAVNVGLSGSVDLQVPGSVDLGGSLIIER
jgi:hypothetical protein